MERLTVVFRHVKKQTEVMGVMLYDGECAVCNRAVKFVAQREKDIRFASLQGEDLKPGGDEAVREAVLRGRAAGKKVDSIVFVDGAKIYVKSAALIQIGRRMKGGWKFLAAVANLAPRALLDAGYDAFAKKRYRLFGTAKACDRPSKELLDRILD